MNDRLRKVDRQLLSDNWYTLWKYSYEYQDSNGDWNLQHREVYDRGDGATILLRNPARGTVILIRQFRMPTWTNGNEDGLVIEACAGLLDGDEPEQCIIKETLEETGYRLERAEKIYEVFMSPGAVTERIHFFIADVDASMRETEGGGLAHEQEDIEVLEIPYAEAWAMIADGRIRDGKTIMLLQHARLNGLLD